MSLLDISNQKFNWLTPVKNLYRNERGAMMWLCKCDCGKEVVYDGSRVKLGKVKSCGCKKNKPKHGGAGTREYISWCAMKSRCTNPNQECYKNYGDRGITICDRWLGSFENFLADMGNSPSSKHTIERVDNDKGYYPGNCRWATRKEQNRNRRSNRLIEINGIKKCATQWCEHFGIPWNTYKARKRNGIPLEKCFLPSGTFRYSNPKL